MKRILIVGGGITGLAAAHHLGELAAAREMPVEVSILERGTRAGGPLKTIRRDGFVIEAGADSFLTEKPAAAELARRIGLATELIPTRPEFRRTYVVRAGRLVEIPEGFSLLAPSRFMSVLGSPLFSTAGKLRIALEPLIPRRADSGDESLASFVTRRLGREVLDRVAQPLAGGIYTADPTRLSISATMPRFVEMERKYGSVIRGLRAAEKARAAQSPGTAGAGGTCSCRSAVGWDRWSKRCSRASAPRFASAPKLAELSVTVTADGRLRWRAGSGWLRTR